jgi:DNA-binding transcriptional MocR family regulator
MPCRPSLPRPVPRVHIEPVPEGGLNLWLHMPDGTDLERLTRDCEASGVIMGHGDEWFLAESAGRFIRFNFSGINPGAFPEGARIIGQMMERNPA